MSPLRAFPRAAAVVAVALPLALAAVPAHADDPAAPTFDCSLYWRYNGVLTWAGTATAPATVHGGVRQLKLTCVYENERGRYASHHERETPVVVTTGAGLLAAGTMTYCGQATVIYNDLHTVTVSTC